MVDCVPPRCHRCRARLTGFDAEPRRSQVLEVPPIRPHVTEYREHELGCAGCGARTRGELPPEAAATFGPRLKSLIAVCTVGHRLSKRVTQELLSDFLGVRLALGSVCNIEREVSEALAAPVEEAREYVRKQLVVHADETGWREAKGRAWLWTAASALVTVFQIAKSRGVGAALARAARSTPGHGSARLRRCRPSLTRLTEGQLSDPKGDLNVLSPRVDWQ